MFEKYLITGATGFLGRTVLAQLRDSKAEIRALVMEGDPLARKLPQNVRVITGDVCNEAALDSSSRARMNIPASFTARG